MPTSSSGSNALACGASSANLSLRSSRGGGAPPPAAGGSGVVFVVAAVFEVAGLAAGAGGFVSLIRGASYIAVHRWTVVRARQRKSEELRAPAAGVVVAR